MATEVIMPKAGMSMETGTIMGWLKSVGDHVDTGEPLVEIETDKVVMEVEAERSGYLIGISHREGDVVPVTRTIGWIGEEGEEPPEAAPAHGSAGPSDPSVAAALEPKPTGGTRAPLGKSRTLRATPAARRAAAHQKTDLSCVAGSGPGGAILKQDVPKPAGSTASPLARKVAAAEAIDIAGIAGSGPGGRIIREDVVSLLAQLVSAGGTAGAAPDQEEGVEESRLTGVRATIARRMLESHLTIPPITLRRDVNVDALLAAREDLRESGESSVSINDLIVRSVALVLPRHPLLRTHLIGDTLYRHSAINIGVAVALPSGLVVPVIRDADRMSLPELARTTSTIVRRVRDGKGTPDDFAGGVFTITNLGMMGVDSFTAIVNPPQSGILGVGRVRDEVAIRDGAAVSTRCMSLMLTVDHRVVDGAVAAAFLGDIADLLERPTWTE